jgi:hypothetical protein
MTTGGVSHLLTWARDIDAMVEDGSMDGFVGICFNQTSVSDTWHISDDEDEWRLYDPSKDEGHWPISDIFE